jgi:hypothetical protein
MSDFVPVYDALPPLNRLCECKFEHWKNTLHARFVHDTVTDKYWWIQQIKNSTFANVPPVVAWRLTDTHEASIQWFQQLPNFKFPSAEVK